MALAVHQSVQLRRLLGLCALLGVWLAACGPAAPPDLGAAVPPTPTATQLPPTATPTESPQIVSPFRGHVTIWASWGPEAMRGLNDRIESFQSEHPNVSFSLAFIPGETMRQRVEQANNRGELPTLYFGPSNWGPSLQEAGALIDVRSMITPEFQRSLQPLAWRQVSYRGEVLGVPLHMHGNVLYRNRALAAVPAANLRDLLQTARSLRGTSFVGAALDFGYRYSTPHAEACGGSILSRDAPPAIDGPLGLCWLQLLQALSTAGPVVLNTDEDYELFASGGAAWWVGSTELHDQLADAIGSLNLAVDPWPVYEATGGRMAGYVWTENAYFSPDLDEDTLLSAWAFVSALMTPEAQFLFTQGNWGSHIPVLNDVEPEAAKVAAMQAALLSGSPLPLWPEAEAYTDTLERAARAVSLQGADPETAQRRAIEELEGPEVGE